jgi:hypothetical protein
MPKSDGDVARSIRMMGQATGQRSSLTVNHGTYYFDTAVSKTTQAKCLTNDPVKNPCVINEFKQNDRYYVFQIFSKADTEQTYRFYVGPIANPSNVSDDPTAYMTIKMTQASIGPNPVVFTAPVSFPDQGNIAKKSEWRVTWYDKAKGIVQVNLRASDVPNFDAKIKDAKKNKCKPETFCRWNAGKETDPGTCEDVAPRDSMKKDAVCRWATVDLDCPDGGCPGFVFTLPGDFKTQDVTDSLRPAVACLRKAAPWDVSFENKSDLVCPKAQDLLAPDFCP